MYDIKWHNRPVLPDVLFGISAVIKKVAMWVA